LAHFVRQNWLLKKLVDRWSLLGVLGQAEENYALELSGVPVGHRGRRVREDSFLQHDLILDIAEATALRSERIIISHQLEHKRAN